MAGAVASAGVGDTVQRRWVLGDAERWIGDGYDILADGWGTRAASHTGFTGTSMALDPVTGRWTVLLTNAVHFGRGRSEVFAARRSFHQRLVQA